ncbi:methyltransferase family protein [Alteromonas sp. a30]|uniref:methyltransferase family protein n=1 Tax=Alteromonas sp. a30 TaxID=2730917 RepID=UPI0022816CE7|nr:isoprenylcysteine carboxylmethyltransferase family protein [Alteromonas sp. a30]
MWLAKQSTLLDLSVPDALLILRKPTFTLFSILGTLLPILGVMSFKQAKTTVDPRDPSKSEHLVITGIYRWTRNPMYLGFLFWLIAWGIYLSDGASLLLAFLFVPYMNRFQIHPEERMLKQFFGRQYEDYCQQVRRWL